LFNAPCLTPAAASNVLDGTHPMLTQVPPKVPRSTMTTLAPSNRALIAADIAAPPEPITARSTTSCDGASMFSP